MTKTNPAYEIERLLQFGLAKNMIEKWDMVPVRNDLMALLKISEPFEGVENTHCEPPLTAPDTAVEILNNLMDYAAREGLLEEDTVTYRDLLDAKIMGLMMPRQSEVVRNFWQTAKQVSIEKATDDFYALSIASNYIRMDRIEKNLYWLAPSEYGDIEITVNLSKPEKDPKAIAAARNMKQSHYPKCVLCLENVGYHGRVNHPARQNHRVIPITLDNEQWYMQYSPYVYYNEHSIVFLEQHSPMKISESTFRRLLDYVEQLPHYFLGSNADLPIVGGSILSHDHFQGGHHVFPMETAMIEKVFYHATYPEMKIGLVKWPMSVIRLSGKDKSQLVQMAVYILETWKAYSDPTVEILAFTEAAEKIPHNTITPIARTNANGDLELDLVLRNNRTTEQHPDGLYHPHQELHHIKKENIGLIEVMGLAVLPGRLDEELKRIKGLLTGKTPYDVDQLSTDEDLKIHLPWISRMVTQYGTEVEETKAEEILKQEVGNIFVRVLQDAGVYKRDEEGQQAFERFMDYAGFNQEAYSKL